MHGEIITFFGFINNLRPLELIIIAFIVLLLFGAKRLPELFRSMGRALGEFKKATRDMENEVRSAMDEENPPQKPAVKQNESDNSTPGKSVEETANKQS